MAVLDGVACGEKCCDSDSSESGQCLWDAHVRRPPCGVWLDPYRSPQPERFSIVGDAPARTVPYRNLSGWRQPFAAWCRNRPGRRHHRCPLATSFATGFGKHCRWWRAIARGKIPDGIDPAEMVKTLVAPFYFRVLITGEPVDESTADAVGLTAARTACSPMTECPLIRLRGGTDRPSHGRPNALACRLLRCSDLLVRAS
ncbi:TetR-like C-terminal domain-containing protein [Nocardia sp. NPDC051990]|uniref:TetR-like C-terminal domain-containing protein n=1 Tax=Nocardia sp. NPDC051990 TaxID=3155285 RepID=UPI003425942B